MPGEVRASLPTEAPEPGVENHRFPVRILYRRAGKPEKGEENLGELRRPWRRSHSRIFKGMALTMAKRNYKVYADIGRSRQLLTRRLRVLDTGAGPNFIRKDELPQGFEEYLRYGPLSNIGDANNKPLSMLGIIDLLVRLGTYLVKVDFIVCDRLAAPVILGCEYCDRFVEAIRPRKKLVELEDGSTIPITRRSLTRPPRAPPLLPSQEFVKSPGRTSPKVKVAKAIELPPESQTWVTVTSQRRGLNVLQPNDKLYSSAQICVTNGVVQVEPDEPFRVLVANFAPHAYKLVKNQVFGTLLPHPTAVLGSDIKLADILGVADTISDVTDSKSQPGEAATAITTTNPESEPINVNSIDLSHVSKHYRTRLREMLRKYSGMWDGSLGKFSPYGEIRHEHQSKTPVQDIHSRHLSKTLLSCLGYDNK